MTKRKFPNSSLRKPDGFWANPQNIRLEVERIIAETGQYPTREYLKANRLTFLPSAASRFYPGGTEALRKDTGFESDKKPIGYWPNADNIRNEVRQLIEATGSFPSHSYMQDHGHSTLSMALRDHYPGGIDALRREFGYESPQRPQGHWMNPENVKDELRSWIDAHGRFPKHKELKELGGIIEGMRRYPGGIAALREELGHPFHNKPKGYWEDKSKVLDTLEQLIVETGEFPTQSQLRERGLVQLGKKFRRYPEEVAALKQKYNIVDDTRPPNFWKDWSNVEPILVQYTEKLGHFPSETDLRSSGEQTLVNALRDYHGGIRKVRERMGADPLNKKPDNYWDDPANIKKEMEDAIQAVGAYPTRKQLRSMRKASLIQALGNYPGGPRRLREELGFAQVERPKGYWLKQENVTAELERIIADTGKFPSPRILREKQLHGLDKAIREHPGGYAAMRAKYGFEEPHRPRGYWQDENNVRSAIANAITKLGHYPTGEELGELGLSTLAGVLGKNSELAEKLKVEFNHTDNKKPAGYWQDPANIRSEMLSAKEKIGHVPNCSELRDHGFATLVSNLKHYPGGYAALCKELGGAEPKKPTGYWDNPENTRRELKVIVDKLGHIPTQKECARLGFSGLNTGMSKYPGGRTALRKEFGFDEGSKPKNYWTKWDNVHAELQESIEKVGHFPNSTELKAIGRQQLLGMICKYHGGLYIVREKNGIWRCSNR